MIYCWIIFECKISVLGVILFLYSIQLLCASRAYLLKLTAYNLVDGRNHFEIISLGADVDFKITAGLLVYVLLNQIDYCFNPFPINSYHTHTV